MAEDRRRCSVVIKSITEQSQTCCDQIAREQKLSNHHLGTI